MNNVILFHGYNGKVNSHWLLWLEKELSYRGFNVRFPDYQNSHRPVMCDWLNLVARCIKDIDRPIFVCHSFGCLVALKVLEELPTSTPLAIFVACPKNILEGDNLLSLMEKSNVEEKVVIKDFIEQNFAWGKITQHSKLIVFCYSDDDPTIPFNETAPYYQQVFPLAEFRTYHHFGHFNYKSNIYQMPDILEILSSTNPRKII